MVGFEVVLELLVCFSGIELCVLCDWLVVINVVLMLGVVNDYIVLLMNFI